MSIVANDNGPSPDARARALSVVYQTRAGAQNAAQRLAIASSPSRLCGGVEFLAHVYVAIEGGVGLEAEMLIEGWRVREVSENEIASRQQSVIREQIRLALKRAEEEEAKARAARTISFISMHKRFSATARNRARELETRLRVASIREAV